MLEGVNKMAEDEKMIDELFADEKLTGKQKKIIEAAIETFSEKGYAASSTSEIAKKAGVAEGTIFRHYKTKKDLLFSIVRPLLTKVLVPFIVNDFDKVLNKKYNHVEDFLRATIENRRDTMAKLLPVVKIVLQEVPFHPEMKKQFIDHVAKVLFDRVSAVIKNYQEQGQLIEMPPESIARLAISSILSFLFTRYILLPDLEWNDEEETEQLIRFILNGIGKN